MPVESRPKSMSWSRLASLLKATVANCQHDLWRQSTEPELLAQCHLFEYQAVTTRITYWITLQYSIGGVTAAALVEFLRHLDELARSVIGFWGAVVVVEYLVGAFVYTLFEIMDNSFFIHDNLADKIRPFLPLGKGFWGYERYRQRTQMYRPWAMYFPLLVSFGALGGALAFLLQYRTLACADYVGGGLSLLVAVWTAFIAHAAVSTQKKMVKNRPAHTAGLSASSK
jgi:hypothetical protein